MASMSFFIRATAVAAVTLVTSACTVMAGSLSLRQTRGYSCTYSTWATVPSGTDLPFGSWMSSISMEAMSFLEAASARRTTSVR